MNQRKVVVYEWQREKGAKCASKVSIGHAIFHQWGVNYEEFETGPGNYSSAIVEFPDGSVQNVSAELIVFNN